MNLVESLLSPSGHQDAKVLVIDRLVSYQIEVLSGPSGFILAINLDCRLSC